MPVRMGLGLLSVQVEEGAAVALTAEDFAGRLPLWPLKADK